MKEPKLIKLKHVEDELSHLVVAEGYVNIPFVPKRVLWVYGFQDGGHRKSKATRVGEQIFIAIHGGFSVKATWFDHGKRKDKEFRLDDPSVGVYMPPGIWRSLSDFTDSAICLDLCSNYHDEDDHIRDFERFKEECGVR